MDCCIICENPSISLSESLKKRTKSREPSSEEVSKSEEQFHDFCKILKIPKANVRKYLSLGNFRKLLLTPFCGPCNILARDLVNFHNQRLILEDEVFNLQKALIRKLTELAKPAKIVDKLFNNLREFSSNAEQNKKRLQAQKDAQKRTKKKILPVPNEKEIVSLKKSFNLAFKAVGQAEVNSSNHKKQQKLIEKFPQNFITTFDYESENISKDSNINTEIEYEDDPSVKIEVEEEVLVLEQSEIKEEEHAKECVDESESLNLGGFGNSAEANQINLLNCLQLELDNNYEDEEITEDPLRLEEDVDFNTGDCESEMELEIEVDDQCELADKNLSINKSPPEGYKSYSKEFKRRMTFVGIQPEPLEQNSENNPSTEKEEGAEGSAQSAVRPRRSCTKTKSKTTAQRKRKREGSDDEQNSDASDWSETHREEENARKFIMKTKKVERHYKNKLNVELEKRAAKKLEQFKCLGDLDLSTKGKLFYNQIEIIEREKKTFECGECGQLEKSTQVDGFSLELSTIPIRRHIAEKHLGGVTCHICSRKFATFGRLEPHMRRFHNGLKECEICGMTTSEPRRMAYHRWMHKNESEKAEAIASGIKPPEPIAKYEKRNYLCTQCGQTFASPKRLSQHEEIHLDPEEREKKKLPCPQCGKLFFKTTLSCHEKYYHKKTTLRRFGCKFCERNFLSKAALAAHTNREHIKDKCFKCDKEGCEWAFYTSGELGQHRKVHGTDRKVFNCDLCEYKTFVRWHVKRHRRTVHKMVTEGPERGQQGQPEGPIGPQSSVPSSQNQNMATINKEYKIKQYGQRVQDPEKSSNVLEGQNDNLQGQVGSHGIEGQCQTEEGSTAGPETTNVNLLVAPNIPTLTNNPVMDYNNCQPGVVYQHPTFDYNGQPPWF